MKYLFSRKYCTSRNRSLGIILSATLNKSAGGCLQLLLLLPVVLSSTLFVLLCLRQNLEIQEYICKMFLYLLIYVVLYYKSVKYINNIKKKKYKYKTELTFSKPFCMIFILFKYL